MEQNIKKDYIIYAPRYGKSNGIRVLYKLAEELNKKGYNAYIFAPISEYKNCRYIEDITKQMRQNAVVVYPEIVKGNPLEFQNVVRYVLYFPGVNGGEKTYDDYELKFTYSKKYYDTPNILNIPTLDTNLFYCDDTVKDIDCYFVHKGGKWKNIPEFSDMVEINSEFPKERTELANLLRKTKTFYSYDRHTQLLEEALLCGCKVKIVTKDGFEDFTCDFKDSNEKFNNELDNFIEITQNHNYKGKIRRVSFCYAMNYKKQKIKYILYKYVLRNEKRALKALNKSRRYL